MSSFFKTMFVGTPNQLRRIPKKVWPMALGLGCLTGLAMTSSSSQAWRQAGIMLSLICCATPLWFMNRWRKFVHVAQAAESTWRALLDGSADGLMVLRVRYDDMGKALGFEISRANRQAQQWFGAHGQDLIGQNLELLFPQPQFALFFQRLHRAIKDQRPIEEEHLYQNLHTPAGATAPTWLHHQIIPIPEGLALVTRDTSEVHRTMSALQEQESFYRSLIDNLPVGVVVKSMRAHSKDQYQVWNRAAHDLLEDPNEEAIGRTAREIFKPEVAQRSEQLDASLLQDPTPHHFTGLPFPTARGERIFDLIKAPVFGADGELDHILTICQDTTERRRAADKVRLASRVLEEIGDAFVLTDSADRVQMVNPAFSHLTGLSPSDVMGKPAELIGMMPLRGSHLAGFEQAMQVQQRWSGESQQVCQDGRMLDIWLNVSALRTPQGKAHQYIRLFSDISALKAQQRELIEQARHDSLTGLPNRRAFTERLEQAMARAKRHRHTLAVVYLDLDGFKAINDQYGHGCGDELLQQVSARLIQCVRTTDTVCRLAGDEFTVILEGAGQIDDLEKVCQRVVDQMSQPIALSNAIAVVGASVGVAVWDQAESLDSICRRADKAMYIAKRDGKACFRIAPMGASLELLSTPRLVGANA